MSKDTRLGQVSNFDLRLLRVFKTVVECGGFTPAEGALGITRSAISMHMSDLERRLGLRLCHRGRGGFALTDEGREALRATEVILAAVENFQTDINQIHKRVRGDLNIGIVNNLVTQPKMNITRALKELSNISHEIHINISMSTPVDIERRLFDGRLHVGVIPSIASLSGLEYKTLYEETFYLYCSREHFLYDPPAGVKPEDLKQVDAIAPTYRMPAQAISLHQLLNCTANGSDREAIAFLILTGRYIGFLPDHYAKRWIDQGALREIFPEKFSYDSTLSLVTCKGRPKNTVVDAFLDAIDRFPHVAA